MMDERRLNLVSQMTKNASVNMRWMYVYMVTLFVSCAATWLAGYHMRRLGGDVFRSTVRFVISCFLLCSSLHALSGGIFYACLIHAMKDYVDDETEALENSESSSSSSALDSFTTNDGHNDGGEAAYITKLTHDTSSLSTTLTALLLLENLFFLLSAYWILLLARELFKLAMATLDRGEKIERKTIFKYLYGALAIIIAFMVPGLSIVIMHDGYNRAYRFLSYTELIIIIVSVLYAIGALVVLRCSGRKHEHIHGVVMASPLYRRLKLLMIVCALFTLPYSFIQLGLLMMPADDVDAVPDYIVGTVTVLYYLFGAAQAFVMGGSQQCCIRMISPIIPTHVRNSPEWVNLRAAWRHDSYQVYEASTPPEQNPVFVNTDIEGSSALWATAPEHVIDAAQELHDDLLRSCLPKFNGYEITTAGDAFQLAFHTISDAVNYCLEVQVRLVDLKWPSELDGMLPSVKTEWAIGLKPQAIFRGIRVRMGIHDASAEEGSLVTQTHPVTGKKLYIGASEYIAREVGDVGYGGQIVISKRVAAYLQGNEDKILTPFYLDYHGSHPVHQLELDIDLFDVTPKLLDARRKIFRKRHQKENGILSDTEGMRFDLHSDTGEDTGLENGTGGEYHSDRTPTERIRASLAKVFWKS